MAVEESVGKKIIASASQAVTCEIVCGECLPMRPFECFTFEAECSKCNKVTTCRVS